MFTWDDQYTLHIEEIDNQHKRLFQLGAQLNKMAKEADTYYDSEALMDIIEDLCEYTVYHFDTEEKHFESSGFPEAHAHAKQHQGFIEFLGTLNIDDIEHRTSASLSDLLAFINEWIVKHIIFEDRKFADFVKQV